jgi:predicted amidohydrolase
MTRSHDLNLGLVQYDPIWEDKERNREKLNSLLSDATDVDLYIFPEMTLTGFTMRSTDLGEELRGPSFRYFSDLATRKSSHVMAGIIERGQAGLFNSLIHITPRGELRAVYRKIHPFSYQGEDEHYARGVSPVSTDVGSWSVGLSICYDLRFPELYRDYGKERTHLIVNIANWPDTRVSHWRSLLRARAIENQCFVAGVNRVGEAPGLRYNGYSAVYDPMGEEMRSSSNEEKVVRVRIQRETVLEIRREFPFLQDIHLI